MIRRLLLVFALVATHAVAGDFFEKDGMALRGYDPVAYFTEAKAVKGRADHSVVYRGSTFHFATKQNRDAFAASPAKYAPQYGGFCAYGTAGGYKAAIDPAAVTVVDGKLYVNYNRVGPKRWSADTPGFIARADRNWPAVSQQAKVIE
jgi:YHS domain-containing protein